MGNTLSSAMSGERDVQYVTDESDTMSQTSVCRESENSEEFHDTIDHDEARAKAKEEEMVEFRRQLNIKREQRKEILARHKAEKKELEMSLENEMKAKFEAYETNRQLRELLARNNIEIPENLETSKEFSDISETIVAMKEEFEELKSNNNRLRRSLADTNVALQDAHSDITDLRAQNIASMKQISALKEVVSVSKTMINLREQQLTELKDKLSDIEQSLADREANMLSADLRQEYERQLQNIRTLRTLYEERARLAEVTRQGIVRELEEQKLLKEAEINKCKELKNKIEELESKVDDLQDIIENKNCQISSCQEETRGLNAEMSAVNKLFSQVLLGYKNKQDLDKLVHRLEENHGLLTHMAERENGSEASSALPKLLLELVNQVDEGEHNTDPKLKQKEESEVTSQEKFAEESDSVNTSAEEIVQNLPKVWRVLMELLSHQTTTEENTSEKITTCYKSVETKSGPVLVPSVSQTYIRLKDLIIEKLALIKEVNRMKQLNVHLETRLEEQEKRLCLVTNELSKTWHVVGRLRRHHHQLHTHEKILKYELQQKRKLLNELKEELEYCREKWEQAREKNSQSERDWRKLRAEFTSRKSKPNVSFNNSAESGYSDERPSDESSESNDEYVTEPVIRSKKKLKKSFETILDSSTDFNLAAEREDPASDMLDVADLPLDTQDGEENNDISDSCNSESLLKSERVCEETEDEVGDIGEDSSIAERCHDSTTTSVELFTNKDSTNNINAKDDNQAQSSNSTSTEIPVIDPAAIMQSIREQNERLATRDKKFERLEKSTTALLNQTQTTVQISDDINDTLDHLLNRTLLNRETGNTTNSKLVTEAEDNNENNLNPSHNQNEITVEPKNVNELNSEPGTSKQKVDNEIPNISLQAILESIKNQKEHLAKKDERLQNLENGCIEVVKELSSTLTTGNEIIQKLDTLHSDHQNNSLEEKNDVYEVISTSRDSSEPSTSSEIDHEARFAARDIRLKRLEEQTKSLVNKVNKTTTKGVKIHYKLEELHNIYGSESSRAGTPSEENEDRPQNDDEGGVE